jgi:transcription initiation factor IIE alpha subunit
MVKNQTSYVYRIRQTTENLKKIISSRTNVYYIGLPECGVKRTISESFRSLGSDTPLSIVDLSLISQDKIESHFTSLLNTNTPSFLLVENLPIYSSTGQDIFTLIERLRDQYPKNTNYIYHFNTNPYWYGIPESSRQIFYFSLSTINEYSDLVDHFLKRFQIKVSQAQANVIYKVTGGHPYLTKKVFELSLQELPADQISQKLLDISNSLISRLHISEVARLKNLSSQDPEFITHFQKLGLINDRNEFTSIVIAESIRVFKSLKQLLIEENTIRLGESDLNNYLSSYESALLIKLSQEKFLTRDQVTEVCWGKLSTTTSDSAVDKMVSRLRQKLVDLGLPESLITTRRGRGFQYIND